MDRTIAAAAFCCMMTMLPPASWSRAAAGPDRSMTYRIVFDLDSPATGSGQVHPGQVDPGLQAVARLVASYASFGVDAAHRRFVVVLHAAGTELALDRAAWAKRHPGRADRNLAAMQALADQGVGFVASEQSMAIRGIDAAALQPFVRTGSSANLVFIDLEAEGFVFTSTASLDRE